MITTFKTSKKLKEMGCEVRSEYFWIPALYRGAKEDYYICDRDCLHHIDKDSTGIYPAYDIRDIICNGEMARAFFGEQGCKNHTENMLVFLQQNKQEEAEEYLLNNCVFNN